MLAVEVRRMIGIGGPLQVPQYGGTSSPWWVGALIAGVIVVAYAVYVWRVSIKLREERRQQHEVEPQATREAA